MQEATKLLTVYGPLGLFCCLLIWGIIALAKYVKFLINKHNSITEQFVKTIAEYKSAQDANTKSLDAHTKSIEAQTRAVENNDALLKELKTLIYTRKL